MGNREASFLFIVVALTVNIHCVIVQTEGCGAQAIFIMLFVKGKRRNAIVIVLVDIIHLVYL